MLGHQRQPKRCSSYCVHICLSILCTDNLITVPYIGEDSMAQQLFYTTARPDDEPVRPKTCRSSGKLTKLITLKHVHFVDLICNNYITMHGVKNVKLLQLLPLLMACRATGSKTRIYKYSVHCPVTARIYYNTLRRNHLYHCTPLMICSSYPTIILSCNPFFTS